jgi:hypothetical protein
MITKAEAAAFARHLLTSASTMVGFLATEHLITVQQAAQASTDIGMIRGGGLWGVVAGISGLVALGSAFYASRTATPAAQIEAVAANPQVQRIVASGDVARASPSTKVVPIPGAN